MKVFKRFDSMNDDFKFNRNVNTLSHFLQRFTGIFLAIFMLVILLSNFGTPSHFYTGIIEMKTGVFALLDFCIMAAIFFHLLNGMRIIFIDTFSLNRINNYFNILMYLIYLVTVVTGLWHFLPKFIG